jgi:hemoglobin-like flavoprotein
MANDLACPPVFSIHYWLVALAAPSPSHCHDVSLAAAHESTMKYNCSTSKQRRVDMKEQGRKLMEMLNTVVQELDRLNELLPQVRELAQRHVQYGVKDSDYDTMDGALLWTLQKGLGKDFTPDVSAAWSTAYMALSDAMRRDIKDPIWPD